MASTYAAADFNSIKVRLELVGSAISAGANILFQFHKGTIRTTENDKEQKNFSHFNSIKVRLEHINDIYSTADTTFQFHKGTIRTKDSVLGKKVSEISIP